MKKSKPSKTLQREATAAQEAATAAAEQARLSQENMSTLAQENLAFENVAQVEAGGTAEELGLETADARRRRRGTSGLSSVLGIG